MMEQLLINLIAIVLLSTVLYIQFGVYAGLLIWHHKIRDAPLSMWFKEMKVIPYMTIFWAPCLWRAVANYWNKNKDSQP